MDDVHKQAVLSAVRSTLIALGGVAVANGYINDTNMMEIVGAVTVILSAAWGIWEKYQQEKKP